MDYEATLDLLKNSLIKLNSAEADIKRTERDLAEGYKHWGIEFEKGKSYSPSVDYTMTRIKDVAGFTGSDKIRDKIQNSEPDRFLQSVSTQLDTAGANLSYHRVGYYKHEFADNFQVMIGDKIVADSDLNQKLVLNEKTEAKVIESVLLPAISEIGKRLEAAEEAVAKTKSELTSVKNGSHPEVLKTKSEMLDYYIDSLEIGFNRENINPSDMKKVDAQGISPTIQQLSKSLLEITNLQKQSAYFSDHKKSVWISDDSEENTKINMNCGSLDLRVSGSPGRSESIFTTNDGLYSISSRGGLTDFGRKWHTINLDQEPILLLNVSENGEVTAIPALGFDTDFDNDPEKREKFEKLSKMLVADVAVPILRDLNAARIDAAQVRSESLRMRRLDNDVMNSSINRIIDENISNHPGNPTNP